MKNLFISLMCAFAITMIYGTSEAAPKPKLTKLQVCNATCIDKWSKEWYLCKGIVPCETYAQHAGEACLRDCQTNQ